jgi:hypothetical protein
MTPKAIHARAGADVTPNKPYGQGGGPGTWRPVAPQPGEAKSNAALVTCAAGHECILSCSEYTIAADRTVTPTYVCPYPGCGLKSDITLGDGP